MNLQIVTLVNGNQEYIELFGDESISLEVSFAEIQDITKKNSAFTKEFDVPGSNQNNYIFNYFFDFNQVPLDWVPTRKFEAWLLYNGYVVMAGYIRLNSVTIDREVKTYSITFYNGVGDVAANIGDKFMAQLDLSHLSHPFTSDVYLQSQLDPNLFPLVGNTNYAYQNGKTFWGLFNIGYNYSESPSAITQYYFATSLSSLSITSGNKTAVLTDTAPYQPGDVVRFTFNAANWMQGTVVSNNKTTNTLVFTPDLALGTGTYSNWIVTLILPERGVYTDPNSTPLLEFNGATPNYFSFSGTPVRQYYFKPAIQIRELYEEIFLQAGYQIDSNFFNTSYFEKFYLPLKFLDASIYTQGSVQPCFTFSGNDVSTIYIDPYDFANNVNAPTCNNIPFTTTSTGFTITAPYGGQYTFEIVTVYNLESDEFNGATFGGGIRVDGADQFFLNASQSAGEGINSYTDTSLVTINIPSGATISLFYDTSFNGFLTTYQFTIYRAPRVIVGDFNYSNEFPPNDFKQIDFITSINKLFNLIVVPSPDKQNTLIVEPIIDYIGKGRTLDWTDKIDWDSPIKVLPTTNFLNGTLNYNFKLDQDQVNQQFNISNNRIFGTYQVQLNEDFKDQVTNFDLIFGSPTDVSLNNANLPALTLASLSTLKTTEINGNPAQKFEPYKIIPRIIFRGVTLPNENWSVATTGETNNWWAETYEQDRFLECHRFNTYPFSYTGFSHYINFNAEDTYDSDESTFPNQQDMYDIYYYDYVSDIVSPENKLISAKIYLYPWEIADLRFNERIIIKNNYYRINKISNYNLTEPSLCDIELVKLTKSYTPHPVKYFRLESCGAGPDYYTSSDLNYNIYAYVGNYVNVFTGATTAYTSTGCYQVTETEKLDNVNYQQVYIASGYTSSGVNVYSDCGCSARTEFDVVQQDYPQPTGPELSPTPTPTITPTSVTPTPTPTITSTPTVTPTITTTTTVTATNTSTPTPSITATITPTNTLTPSVTPTTTITPSVTLTMTPTTSPAAPFDSDAAAYLAAVVSNGGTVSPTASAATNTLFTQLKSNSLYSKLKVMYPMLGGVANSVKFNALNPLDTNAAFRMTYVGTPTFNASGMTTANADLASTHYANTYFNLSTQFASNVITSGIYFVNFRASSVNTFWFGAYEGAVPERFLSIEWDSLTNNGEIFSRANDINHSISYTNIKGQYTLGNDGTNNYFRYNGASVGTNTDTTTRPNANIFLGVLNLGGTPYRGANAQYSFFYVSDYLNTSEAATMETLINNFQTSLGRNTY